MPAIGLFFEKDFSLTALAVPSLKIVNALIVVVEEIFKRFRIDK